MNHKQEHTTFKRFWNHQNYNIFTKSCHHTALKYMGNSTSWRYAYMPRVWDCTNICDRQWSTKCPCYIHYSRYKCVLGLLQNLSFKWYIATMSILPQRNNKNKNKKAHYLFSPLSELNLSL